MTVTLGGTETLLFYHNFPAWARGNIFYLCLEKFLSIWDTPPSGCRFPRRRGRRRYIFMIYG
jgi:hypothetical protein